MQIKSIDNPKNDPSGIERASAEAAPSVAREIVAAKPGAADGTSRAAQFLVTGKRSHPLRNPLSVLESRLIEGVDRRERILETDLSPWRMICALDIVNKNGLRYVGTGWFIGPRTVVTAGHCVFDPLELGGWAKSVTVMPGRNGDQMQGSSRSSSFSTTDRWMESQDPDFDYAAIHLDEDLGTAAGAFGMAVLPDGDLVERMVNVSGYPGSPGGGAHQYFHANRIKAVTPRRVFYDIDTMGGQSGSPVWAYLDDDTTKPVVVGIHAYGVGGTPSNLGLRVNSGPRILPESMALIKAWSERGSGG